MRQKAGDAIQVGPREIDTSYGTVMLMHEPFALRAAEVSGLYRFVFYGHTHKVDIRRAGDVLVVNPGEACGYLTGKATVALVNPETLEVDLVEVADVDR
jgi:putative phosphoesterase